ncbi:TolC family protein, partial [Sulfurihydrogenibium sp.]|uniref:TolC family protein n=1 Tax=Sulfurihydrogenibium sp. TaxID=2053621 RepID=UPI00260BF360
NNLEKISSLKERYYLSFPNPKITFGFNNIELNKPYLSSNNPMGSFSIGITQEYVPFIKRKLESEIYSKEKEVVKISKYIFQKQLKRQIKENYVDFIFTYRKEEILKNQLNLYNNYKSIAEEYYKYGKSGLKDILSIDTKILEIQKDLEQVYKEREIQKHRIFYLIGGYFPLKDDKDIEFEEIQSKSVEDSPYLKQIYLEIEKIDNEIQKSKVEYLPNLEFMGEYMYRTGMPDMITFKVGVQIPVFKSKKEDLVVLQKKEEKLIKQLNLEDEKLKLTNTVLSIKSTYEKNNKILKLYKNLIYEKEKQIKAIELSLKYNKSDFKELIDILNEVLQLNLEMLNLRVENLKLIFQLEEVL